MTESVPSTQLTNTAPSCPFTWWACETPISDLSSLEDDSLPVVNPVPNAPGVQNPEQVLTREEKNIFVREILGYGNISKYSFSDVEDKQDQIWQALLAAGYVDASGNIQKKLYTDLSASAFSLNVPQLTEQGKMKVQNILRLALPPIYDNYLDTLISNANQMASAASSADITRGAVARILSDGLLRDTLRVNFMSLLSYNSFQRVPLAGAGADANALEDLASSAAASGALGPVQLQALRSGTFDIKVVSTTDERGEVDGYRVILEIGYHNDTVAEYRDGQFTRGGEENPPSPLAMGVIAYLQRLLAANGYLSLDQNYREGIFNLQTLAALQNFMSNKNLTVSFHAPTTTAILDQKLQEANEAFGRYTAATNNTRGSDLSQRYTRYEVAQEALNKLAAALEYAERYRDIPDQNLSQEEKDFRDKCRTEAQNLKNRIREIFGAIINLQDPAQGLINLDWNTLTARREDIEKARTGRKKHEAYNRMIDTALRIISNLRRWQRLAQYDPALYQALESYTQSLVGDLRTAYVNEFPEEARHLEEALQLIDQGVLADIEGEGTPVTSDPSALRLQYFRAAQISDALGTHPARALILGLIRQQIQDRSSTKVGELFAAFGRLVNAQGGNLETVGRYYLNQNIREAVEGRSGSGELSWGMANTMDYLNASLSSYGETMRGKLINLAVSLVSLMDQYNLYARESGLPELTFDKMMEAAGIVTGNIQDLSPEDAKKTLETLANLSDSPVTARDELAQMYENEMDKLSLSDNKRLKGSSNVLVVSPKVISELEKGVSTNQALNGAVAYEDLARWGENNEWVQAHLPAGAQAGEFFYVSSLGIQRVPAEELANIERIPTNNLAGTEYERNPIEFIHNERIAALKLAMSRYVPVSDKQVLMLSGMVTARLMATDLEGIIKVFGEGTHWIIRPGSLSLLPLEGSALRKAAGSLEYSGNPAADLIRRLASGETRFTEEEKQKLDDFFRNLNTAEFVNSCGILDAAEKEALSGAVSKIKFALGRMHHKAGLNAQQQDILKKLAGYLGDEAITDARLTSEEPSEELLAKLRSNPGFNEAEFKSVYAQAVAILRDVHGQLAVLASKYPPEAEGWNDNYLPLLLFNSRHLERTLEAATETIASPSQADFLMAGVANDQVFEMNIILSPELVNRLASINTELDALKDDLQITEGLLASNALTQKVKACQDYYGEVLKPLLDELKALRETLREGNPLDDTLRERINSFEQLVNQLQNYYNSNPSNYVVGAEGLLEQIQTMLVTLGNDRQTQIDALAHRDPEEGAGQRTKRENIRDTLTRIIDALNLGTAEKPAIVKRLTDLIAERNQAIPEYQRKFELEVERQEIIDQLSSDRFDTKKFIGLFAKFSGVLGEQTLEASILDYTASIFTGDNGEILDHRGQNTRKTIGQILTDFFDTNHDGKVDGNDESRSLPLANLLPEPGEDYAVTLAKIALSKFFEKLPREQVLDLLKTIPRMVGMHGFAPAIAAVGSRYAGGVGVTFGPQTPEELLAVNNPAWRLQNAFVSFMALSSDQQPRMNLSSQVYMMLAGTLSGQEYLTRALAGADPRSFAFNKVDQDTMQAFLEYFKKEVLPHINNPRLAQRIQHLEKTHKIPLNLNELGNVSHWEHLIDGLSAEDFELFDSFNTTGDKMKLAQFVETVMKVVGEINQGQAVEEIENYSITYFDPLQTLRDICPQYRDEPPREVTTIRYETLDAPDALPDFIENLIENSQTMNDAADWINMYGEKAVNGVYDEMTNNFGSFIWEAAKGSGGFAVNFGVFMGKQIGMGFSDTLGGLGDFLSAARSGDKDKMLAALQRAYDGLAQTTGAFVMFETLPFLFYSEVLAEIEAGNYSKAFGKFAAITLMTVRSMRATVDIAEGLIRGGQAYWNKAAGTLHIKNPAKAARLYQMRMARAHRLFGGRLGLRLAWYQLNPFSLPTKLIGGAYRMATNGVRYASGNLSVQVSRSPVQISLAESASESPSTWAKISDAAKLRSLRMYRYGPGKFVRNAVHGFGVPGRAASLVNFWAGGSTQAAPALAGMGPENIPGDLFLARTEPGTYLTLTLQKGTAEMGRISISGETYLELVQARAQGNFGKFRAIIHRYGRAYQAGTIRQLYHSFDNPANAYNDAEVKAFLDSLPSQSAGGLGIEPYKFLQQSTVGKNFANKYTLTFADGSTQTVTGRQITEILYNRHMQGSQTPLISAEADAQIASLFEGNIDPIDLQKMLHKVGVRYIEGARTGRHKFADSLYITERSMPGWVRRMTHIWGEFGRPGIATVDAMEARLSESDPRVIEYAKQHKMTPMRAKLMLADQLYNRYVCERAKLIKQILEQGAKNHLSARQLAALERQGGVLRRGLIFGRQFQKVMKNIRPDLLQKLAEFDANFSPNAEVERVLRSEQMAVPDSGFNLEMEFLQAGIRTNVMDFNRAFEGIDESLQRRFLEAAKKAGIKRIEIEESVNFGSGGEESLQRIISDMEQGKLPKKFKIVARDGNIFIKGRLRLSTGTASMSGAGAIERAADVRVGGNGLASADVEAAAGREFTVEELSQAHELLQKMGFTEAEIGNVATKEAFLEKVGQKFGERLPTYLRELQRTNPNKYNQLLQKMIRPSLGQRAVVTGVGAVVGLLSYFPLEFLLDVMGIDGENSRFVGLILGGLGTNAATSAVVNRLVLGKTAMAIERGLSNVSWANKIGVGGVNLLAGLGYASISADIWVKILDDFGVGQNSALRKELAMFLVGSGAPMAIELGGGAALNGMNALATRMGFQTVAGATVGRAMWVLGLARVGSDMTQWLFDDYEESVNDRARDYQRLQLARGGTGSKILLFADCFFDPILGAFQDATTAMVDDGSRAHIAEEDAEQIAAWQPRVLNTLFSAWMADSGQDMFSYDGTTAPDISFFQNPQLPSMEKLSEIVNQDIEFTNHQPVLGTYNVTLDDEEVAGNAGGTQTVHVYGEMVREADAYQYLMNNPNAPQDKLVETLKNEYNIQDVEGFLQKVSMKNVREQIISIVGMRPDEIDPSTLSIADNRKLRQIFDSGTGKMNAGQESQLSALLMQGENGKMLQALAEFRKVQRLQALLTGRATATDVDIQLGLVKADGSIDEQSATYALLQQQLDSMLALAQNGQPTTA